MFAEKERQRQTAIDFAIRVNREVCVRMGTFLPQTVEERGWSREGLVDVSKMDTFKEYRNA